MDNDYTKNTREVLTIAEELHRIAMRLKYNKARKIEVLQQTNVLGEKINELINELTE